MEWLGFVVSRHCCAVQLLICTVIVWRRAISIAHLHLGLIESVFGHDLSLQCRP
jgi:hypothetical protein